MVLNNNNFFDEFVNILAEASDVLNEKKANNQNNKNNQMVKTQTNKTIKKNVNKDIEKAQEEVWDFAKTLFSFSKDKNRLYFGTEVSPLNSAELYKTVKRWVEEYEEEREKKNISVGDEVFLQGDNEKFIVTHINNDKQTLQGFNKYGIVITAPKNRCTKTNQSSPVILSILKSMQE